MPEKSMDEVMEAAAGAHFSGLRLDSLRLSSPSTPSSPSSARASQVLSPESASSASAAGPRQPFVIGNLFLWAVGFCLGVSGGTASGKTTVCDMIIQQLHDHRVVLVNQVRNCCLGSLFGI
ncbi:hypothetical protein GW17_00043988 [Ensete ventricosum]|nr:hypothetical protein GW17_00043988 [Ensete ventricosum]RZS06876.1 hypothetical protein BHM03_00037651 [Ensete ventricosum]